MRFFRLILIASLVLATFRLSHQYYSSQLVPPVLINTWNFSRANARGWIELEEGRSALDAVEKGCSQCEEDQCDGTVGWGGSPSENGETTLDAMIMDGETYDVGAVGGLRRVKNAIGVARMVLERTNHTLLVGDMATEFALSLGFPEESLTSPKSRKMNESWRNNSCQPNYWRNVYPDPRKQCGPYKPLPLSEDGRSSDASGSRGSHENAERLDSYEEALLHDAAWSTNTLEDALARGHDTIGMIAMDSKRRLASGTSTNGLRNKILGRVGDSPVPGAGSYAAREAGAAAATGDGDVMMRFLLSYQAVENLRQGMNASQAARDVVMRQVRRTGRPYPMTGVVVLAKDGSFGAACCGMVEFPFIVSDARQQHLTTVIKCVV